MSDTGTRETGGDAAVMEAETPEQAVTHVRIEYCPS